MAHDDTKVYALNLFDVADREEYLAYSRRSALEVARHGGHVVALGRFRESVTGDITPRQVLILVEWESRAAFDSYRQDPALADLHPHRERGSSAYVWHLFDRLEDLRPLLRPLPEPGEIRAHAADRKWSVVPRNSTGRHVHDVSAETPCAEFHKPLPRKRSLMCVIPAMYPQLTCGDVMAGITVFRQLSRRRGVSLTLPKEDIMPSANRMTTPVVADEARIEGRHASLGDYTGLNCSYEPDPADNLDWVLDWEPTQA